MTTSKAYLAVNRVTKRFGSVTVLDGIDLSVARGEFVSLLGPSGCGKTTLLRLIAGLTGPDEGSIRLDGVDLTRVPAHKRNIGMVLQNYALFPHLSVAGNVAFGLKARRIDKATIAQTVANALGMVRMESFADRPITGLSGGQQQRVAVARSLAPRPSLLLLDEPFSALDRKLREHMEIELHHLLRELAITAIFVTHDQDEALVMSDRIAVMNHGVIEQFADPAALYTCPATLFAMEFMGLSTRLHGKVAAFDGGTILIETAQGIIRASAKADLATGDRVVVGVRPEKIELGEQATADANSTKFTVADAVYFGSKLQLHFKVMEGDVGVAEVNPSRASTVSPGTDVAVHWPVADTLVYRAEATEGIRQW